MTALYLLAEEYRAAAEKLADLDLDEQTVADTLESLAGSVEVKATNVAAFARNLEALADQIDEAERSMAARRKALTRRAATAFSTVRRWPHSGRRRRLHGWRFCANTSIFRFFIRMHASRCAQRDAERIQRFSKKRCAIRIRS